MSNTGKRRVYWQVLVTLDDPEKGGIGTRRKVSIFYGRDLIDTAYGPFAKENFERLAEQLNKSRLEPIKKCVADAANTDSELKIIAREFC